MAANGHNRHSSEETEKRQKELQRLQDQKQQFENDLAKLLRMPEFRSVMSNFLGRSGIYRVTHTGNSQGAFLEGRRSLGLEMLAECSKVTGNAALDLVKIDFGDPDV